MDQNSGLIEHDKLYFADGDVVLSAKNETLEPQATVLFRVDKLFLSRHSEVFHNMFADASEFGQETYDGVPLVPMTDRGEDLALLISIIYDPSALHNFLEGTPPAELATQVLGLADISRKYMVGKVCETIVAKVQSLWPTTLEEWDAHRRRLGEAQMEYIPESIEACGGAFPEPASTIVFALKHDVPSVLPAAFYQLACTRFDHVYGNDERPGDRFGAVQGFLAAHWELLDMQTLRRFLLGKEYMLGDFKATFDGLADEVQADPSFHPGRSHEERHQRALCEPIMKDAVTARLEDRLCSVSNLADLDCLQILEESNFHVHVAELCFSCKLLVNQHVDAHRERIWGCLPEWFRTEGDT
ncbi:hypothetical protein PsYK624_120690 [Phanerochaete sordida]|uniref:BTB domain-containing protein n=1 Tax=Phanerochaete sordida TaxID=48140 RepID=A0A9P3LI91_9APHY|nr:hypothetical protein PsYK624_120690 [Phanerochaete sordida]